MNILKWIWHKNFDMCECSCLGALLCVDCANICKTFVFAFP